MFSKLRFPRKNKLFKPRDSVTLIIGDAGYRLIRFKGREIVETQEWPRIEEARPIIMDRLLELEDHRLNILVDSVEQTYRREEIPGANLIDRRRIIERRLEVAFPTSTLCRAIHLSKDKGNVGTQQNYLFAALPDSDELKNWIRDLGTLNQSIDGIGLLPLEVAARTSRLHSLIADRSVVAGKDDQAGSKIDAKDTHPWLLIIGRQQSGGIRQIVLHNQTLTLTRLAAAPSADLSDDMLAEQFQRNIKSTLNYLSRLGYQNGSPLTMLVFADEALRQKNLRTTLTRCRYLSYRDDAE